MVMAVVARLTREVFARELLPARARWWMAAAGMVDWYTVVAARLRGQVAGDARELLSRLSARMFERRYEVLRAAHPELPDAAHDRRALRLVMAALYRIGPRQRRGGWILGALGGPPRGAREQLAAARLVGRLDAAARWREMTCHLGELLIVLTEDLPAHLPRARAVLGDICFDAGVAYARVMRRRLRLPEAPADPAAIAIEVLRTSEYVFRVNPQHWGGTDAAARTGWLEGSACPWFDRPGWQAGHCGIFGQFQNGVCHEFGLRYRLGQTIPKHGGTTCRVDLSPIPLSPPRRSAPATASGP
jgi:hypothetical protein